MPRSAAALRLEIEATLSQRIPGALSPRSRQVAELFPTGIAAIDTLLDGGIPRGGVSEIVGLASTGRTALVLSAVAALTQKGAACAWVDVDDTLDPESAAACGMALERLLWIRAGGATSDAGTPPPPTSHRAVSMQEPASPHGNCLHPRCEVRNLDRAVSQLFRGENGVRWNQPISTPKAPNRPLTDFSPRCAEPQPHRRKQEQVPTDRLPPRRGEAVLQVRPKSPIVRSSDAQLRKSRAAWIDKARMDKPWSRLDQSLQAIDLLLQAGGFSMIVLDMGNLMAEQALRVPLATWYRFRLAAEQAQAALVLLTQTSCTKSCASLVLHCERALKTECWSAVPQAALMEGIEYRVAVERKRGEQEGLGKKPAGKVAAHWVGPSQWIR